MTHRIAEDLTMKTIKVMTVFGTRPEAIKMAPLVHELERTDGVESIVCVTAQHRQMLDQGMDIFHLKALIDLVGRMTDNPRICNLFLITDIPNNPERLYKSYSDAELKRLNSAIVTADVQVARALILHQMLGTRISDTLTFFPLVYP